MTAYPPPPWILRGDAFAAPLLLRRSRIAIPQPLKAAVPGPFLPAVAVAARYGPGSSLAYHELALLVPVRHGLRPGVYVAGLWVDEPASVDGGRSIWGLAKELAQFDWVEEGGAVRVWIHARAGALARFRARRLGPSLPLPFPLALRVFQARAGRVGSFRVRLRARVQLAVLSPGAEPERTRGAVLPGEGIRLGFGFDRLDATVFPPRRV